MLNKDLTMAEIYPVLQEVLASGGEFRFYPRGTSMLPLIREGRDSVVLEAVEKPQKHDMCLYRRANGQFVLHRLMGWDAAGAPVFCGDNQLTPEHGVPADAIIARVSAVYHGDKRKPVTALSYRCYVRLHCFMPWRRLRFFPRRAWGFIKRKWIT
ncbi:MAG: hypothetical protein E7644_05885 [Ruminococcaceae bacterium]|nr:hypothetical protein [Oscillospiraceae bacterium]